MMRLFLGRCVAHRVRLRLGHGVAGRSVRSLNPLSKSHHRRHKCQHACVDVPNFFPSSSLTSNKLSSLLCLLTFVQNDFLYVSNSAISRPYLHLRHLHINPCDHSLINTGITPILQEARQRSLSTQRYLRLRQHNR